MAHKHTFRDVEVAYDYRALHKWSVQKALAGASGPQAFFSAVDEVLCGQSDEVAEQIGGTTEDMGALMNELALLFNESKT